MLKKFVRNLLSKNLSALILSIFLLSCQSTKSPEKIEPAKPQEVVEPQQKSEYETVDSENQAEAINKENNPSENEVEVQDRVFFGTNSSTLDDDAKKILEVQSEWLKSDATIKITIEGHCDERGTREYNIALGEKRAYAVKKYLKQKGIAESRIKVVSYGKERPAFIGNSDEIHAKNRRGVTVVN